MMSIGTPSDEELQLCLHSNVSSDEPPRLNVRVSELDQLRTKLDALAEDVTGISSTNDTATTKLDMLSTSLASMNTYKCAVDNACELLDLRATTINNSMSIISQCLEDIELAIDKIEQDTWQNAVDIVADEEDCESELDELEEHVQLIRALLLEGSDNKGALRQMAAIASARTTS